MKIVLSHFDFVLGVPVQSLPTEPLTVHAEFPDSFILYWDCVERKICPHMNVQTAGSAIVPEALRKS